MERRSRNQIVLVLRRPDFASGPRVSCPVNKEARQIKALGRSREPPACPEGFRRLLTCRAATLSRGRGTAPLPGLAAFQYFWGWLPSVGPFAITNRSCSCPRNRSHPKAPSRDDENEDKKILAESFRSALRLFWL